MKPIQEKNRKNYEQINYRKFLATFKTQPCPESEPHNFDQCPYYHTICDQDQYFCSETLPMHKIYSKRSWDYRRNPYSKMNEIIYNPQYCEHITQNCQIEKCKYCHNAWEYNYHPLIFKTEGCQNFYEQCCEYCSKIHYYDVRIMQKNKTMVLDFSQFFRFDLLTFKTTQCTKQYGHDKNSCLYYHNSKDCRRTNFQDYGHILCKKAEEALCQDINCPFSHNKIQQLYHPSRYKSKFCQNHYKSKSRDPESKSLCSYGEFCSFAHDQSELSVELIDKLPRTLQFHLYIYKTVWCPITVDHNRSQCVYAHNIQDFRRNPKKYYYEPEECPDWKKNQNIKGIEDAGCPRGMQCNKCHGWKEKQYHPVIYCKPKTGEVKMKEKEKLDNHTSSEGKDKTDSSHPREVMNIQAVNRKLGTSMKGNNKIEEIIHSQLKVTNKPFYAPGTPFFKTSTRNTKVKSKSQRGDVIKSQDEDKKGSLIVEKQSNLTTKSIHMKSNFNIIDNQDDFQRQIFKAFETSAENNGNEEKLPNVVLRKGHYSGSQAGREEKIKYKEKTRITSKSLGSKKISPSLYYSNELTEALSLNIIKILQERKINEIKLLNMGEEQIRRIDGLSTSQKSLIIININKSKPSLKVTPTYTNSLEKFFFKHNRRDILLKMKTKRVKQEKLLLLDSQIKQLSFLSESQKNELPEIIREFTDNQEFDSLSKDIVKSIGSSKQNY